jgi:cellulose 1,4-beta-cellobiosidase
MTMRTWDRLGSVLTRPLVLCLAVIPGTAGASGPSAETVRTCDPFGTVSVADGRYIVQQNEWNSTDRQCMRVSGRSWTITRASFDLATDGPPASYPSVFRGCHWGNCTSEAPLPIQVGDIAGATSSWRTNLTRSGAYDVAYDLWTNTSVSTSGQPDGSEIMLWLSERGDVRPAGSVVGRVRIAGTRWTVWTTRMASWNYVAYRRVRPTDSVSALDLAAFLRDSVERGLTEPSWYLIAAEAGFEIWRGGRGLATRWFAIHVRRAAATG